MRIAGFITAMGIGLVLALPAQAGEEHPTPAAPSAELARIQKLAGKWEGTGSMAGEEQKLAVEYKLTAGGSAVVETLFPGTPHEMVSVYYDQGGKTAMTHYCMMGNHPELSLRETGADKMTFSLAPGGDVNVSEPHMHELVMAWQDADHMTQAWTSYENGQAKETSTFNFTRIQ